MYIYIYIYIFIYFISMHILRIPRIHHIPRIGCHQLRLRIFLPRAPGFRKT